MKRTNLLCTITIVLVSCVSLGAQAMGPDVIVGDMPNVSNYGSSGGISAFAVGTTSCNLGNQNLNWFANNNNHPVISQNMYRYNNNRFEQVGQSWLKHGFAALAGNICDTCTGGGGSVLNPGCSDPYSSGLNGSQGGLGPKFQVNAATGDYPYPYSTNGGPGSGTIARRLQVANTDLDPTLNAGAQYFVESQYIAKDDASFGNDLNNASYRPINVSGSGSSFTISVTGSTQREDQGILAWQALDPQVHIATVDVANDGRFIVAYLATDVGGGLFDIEVAIQNHNSHRSGQAVTLNFSGATSFSNIGFHDVDYHSADGEIAGQSFDGTDWQSSTTGNTISWSTQTFAANDNANALRWGTLYNFRCRANSLPTSLDLTLYRPGTPTSVSVPLPVPSFTISFPSGTPASIAPSTAFDVDIDTTTIGAGPDAATAMGFVSTNGSSFVSQNLQNLGGGNFRMTLPASACLDTLDWYVSIEPLGGGAAVVAPNGAPGTTNSTFVSGVNVFATDFETGTGSWSVSGNANDGQWNAGVPVGGGDRGDPAVDSDGSGACFLTDNVDGNSDVDNGTTILTSPAFDLSGASDAAISCQIWLDLDDLGFDGVDSMTIEISDNNGASWQTVEVYQGSSGNWESRTIDVGSHVSLTSQVRVRFSVSDLGNGDIVEAGLDAFRVDLCPSGPYLTGPAAAGTAGGTGETVLTVNGSDGGTLRRVDIGLSQPITFSMLQPSTNPNPAFFRLWGMFGWPTPGLSVTLPFGIGNMGMIPCDLDPANSSLFVLANNITTSTCPPLVGSFPGNWSFTHAPGLVFPFTFTLQPVTNDNVGAFGISPGNAVIVNIN